MIKKLCTIGLLMIICALHADAQAKRFKSFDMLFKSASASGIVETARDHGYSIDFTKQNSKDSVHIVAIRVQFRADNSDLTTGDGRFGMNDRRERDRYSDGTYKFDGLPHDSAYFANQLSALSGYYDKVSRGNLSLSYSIYPRGSGETGYEVDSQMVYYSPGWKRRTEKIDEYWDRKTHGLMTFVKEALEVANRNQNDSPFGNLYRDDDGILRDAATGRKAVILIFHAGASYLTDGGLSNSPDSPSDMIDAFIDREFFRYFKDTLGLQAEGITVDGNAGKVVIDEIMMCSETSNQDGLNWGIQGILVNQMARQLGIPDLFSTSSGVSAIGAFCIMDFAGYSAGQGFIPPYPSAWARAFMGWDRPAVVGAGNSHRVKALSSVLDPDNGGAWASGNDTSVLLVPINNNEYYLIENRQRNLRNDPSAFNYDEDGLISAYPYNVNIGANVKRSSGGGSNVILETYNNDISLPASGVLVWHVDERIIRQRLQYNFVNADSSYRGVRLVEADGIGDLGVLFVDAFYQAAYDYGGAEDVFPHKTTRAGGSVSTVSGFGPYSRPSTRSNDGGHSYLDITFSASGSPREERTRGLGGSTVVNYSDSVFLVGVTFNHIVPGWPRRAAPEKPNGVSAPVYFFDPLITEIGQQPSGDTDTVLALLSESGKFYLYSVKDGSGAESYGNRATNVNFVDYNGKPAGSPVSVKYFDDIPGAFTFPTAFDNRIYIPSTQTDLSGKHTVHVYSSTDPTHKGTHNLPDAPSSYVCGLGGGVWAIGLRNGTVFGHLSDGQQWISDTLSPNSPVCAIAALTDTDRTTFAAIQDDGTLSILRYAQNGNFEIIGSANVKNGIGPYTLVTGDLDGDGKSEIVVSDSRQGVWVYTYDVVKNDTTEFRDLKLAQGWSEKPNDWASVYHIDPQNRSGRDRYPKNFSAPALADLNRNGNLDIIISGTNGIYALNRRGALLSRWPAYLDNRYWYQRGSVTTPPVVVSANGNQPLVLFSSPTGERATFGIVKIETANKESGVVTFRREDGTLDSLWDLSAAYIDTILTIADSLVYPYVLPGGFVDALTASAARPLENAPSWTWAIPQSRWPASTGAPVATSPLVYRASRNAAPNLFAVTNDGMIYRWELNGMLSDSLYWPQNGFDAARSFAYGGPVTGAEEIIENRVKTPITFWNYPNPTAKSDSHTTFKYQFSGRAENVRLDIHTITGRRMDTFKNLSGDFPDWNEFRVDLRKYGPGIYRCRMEATINGKKHSKMWKMAVVK